jgi:hypothetical protein
VFISMNALADDARSRTRGDVATIRQLPERINKLLSILNSPIQHIDLHVKFS